MQNAPTPVVQKVETHRVGECGHTAASAPRVRQRRLPPTAAT
jgi:hypothetical protein